MPTNRIKKTVRPAITSREEFENLIGNVTEKIIAQRDLKNAMDAELLTVRAKYEAEFPSLEKEINDLVTQAQTYCDAHPEMFGKHRSVELIHAEVGYRTSTPAVKLLKGWTWAKTLDSILSHAFQFTRTKVEVDKEAILAFMASETDKARLDAKVLRPIGVKIEQSETFFIEPKLEKQESRKTEVSK